MLLLDAEINSVCAGEAGYWNCNLLLYMRVLFQLKSLSVTAKNRFLK